MLITVKKILSEFIKKKIMSSRIIVSSRSFERYLDKVTSRSFTFDDVPVKLEKVGRLFINSDKNYMDCEVQNDFETTVKRATLVRLFNFLNLIEEQPLTLEFDDSGYITIKDLVL